MGGMKEERDQKADAYSKSILSRRLFSLFNEQKNKGGLTLGFAKQYSDYIPRTLDEWIDYYSLGEDRRK